jgi:nucleolar protein 58
MNAMVLGLSHSLSRYKLKFSPDKVDTMIVQAIALLDDLDKELNTYAMRVKEWYGWHFPELGKVLIDNVAYAKTVKLMGFRTNASSKDFSSILPEELEAELKTLAEVSMGTEISDEDIDNITYLCDQIISIAEYRTQLYDYLKNRMMAIAPNLTTLVGELVGARLIAHAGSLLNLAKAPASTIQILGAEKALFRALKSKHDTPKYGLIYHASLVGQAGPKIKGKMARMVATKTSLAVRCDALGEAPTTTVEGEEGEAPVITSVPVEPELGLKVRAQLEARLRQLEGKAVRSANATPMGSGKKEKSTPKFEMKSTKGYNAQSDAIVSSPMETLSPAPAATEEGEKPSKTKKDKKRKAEDEELEPVKKEEKSSSPEKKKAKKEKKKSSKKHQE